MKEFDNSSHTKIVLLLSPRVRWLNESRFVLRPGWPSQTVQPMRGPGYRELNNR